MFENVGTVDKSIFNKYEINIEDLIPKILDTIVEVYGEKHREVIENRLQSIVINPYITANDIRNVYNYEENRIQDLLAIEFLKEIGKEVPKEEADKVYKDGTYALNQEHKNILRTFFDWDSIQALGPIFDFDEEKFNNANEWQRKNMIENRCKILKQYGLDIMPLNYEQIISSKEGITAMEQIMKIYEIVQNLKIKYDNWEKDHEQEKKYIVDCREIEGQLNIEYIKEFYKQIMQYVSTEDRQNIEEALNSQSNMIWQFLEKADPDEIYSSTFSSGAKLEFFHEKYDEKINENSYDAKNIRKRRIEYFKLKGIDLGDDYSLYENSEETKRIWPNKDIVKKIYEIKEKLLKAKEEELLIRTSNYVESKEKLSKYNFVLNHEFNVDLIKEGTICAVPNFVENADGTNKDLNIIHLPILRLLKEYKDVNSIHEILHIVEASIKPISKEKVSIKTGFEVFEENTFKSEETPEEDFSNELREWEIFSENVHQNIAMEVTEKLHKKGIYLFDDPKIAKTRGSTSYEQLNMLTQEFREAFSQEIKDARLGEDLSILYNAVGEQNLRSLNSIVKEYRSLDYYKMMNDVIGKRDTELTRKRSELINKANEITQKMKEYNQEHNLEHDYEIKTQKIGQVTVNQPYTSKKIATSVLQETVEKIKEGEQSLDGQ